MNRQAPKFDRTLLIGATSRAKLRYDQAVELAKRLEEDADKVSRLAEQRCKSCFYFRSMGGAACTSQPCACCGAVGVYGSTNTEVLCLECAKKHELCKRCGGDLEMRERRRNWPV